MAPFLRITDPSTERTSNSPRNQSAPNLLIVLFDALSAKNMSLYGYHRETSPNMARFAERATVYHAHYAAGNFTPPGTSSLLTGTYPWTHRAFHIGGTVTDHYKHRNLFRAFAGGTYNRIAYTHNRLVTLLLNQFRDDVDAYVDPGEFGLVDSQIADQLFLRDANIAYLSLEQLVVPSRHVKSGSLFLGLAHYAWTVAASKALYREHGSLYPRGVPELWHLFFLLEHAIDGMEALISSSREPFLGYFHLLPPHPPYSPRRDFVDTFNDGWEPVAKRPHFFSQGHPDGWLNQQRRHYDEYIAYVDAEFGRLHDFLARTGALDSTYVVVTSDHGNMFERGIIWEHTTPTLYEPVIRIPLLISKPGQRHREDVYTPTSCVDLLPTLLQATNRSIPDWCEGEPLPGFGGGGRSGERSIFSVEARSNPKQMALARGTAALVKGQYKLIHYFGYRGYEDETELYDLANDPEEIEDLYLSKRSVAADLRNEMDDKLREVNRAYL